MIAIGESLRLFVSLLFKGGFLGLDLLFPLCFRSRFFFSVFIQAAVATGLYLEVNDGLLVQQIKIEYLTKPYIPPKRNGRYRANAPKFNG